MNTEPRLEASAVRQSECRNGRPGGAPLRLRPPLRGRPGHQHRARRQQPHRRHEQRRRVRRQLLRSRLARLCVLKLVSRLAPGHFMPGHAGDHAPAHSDKQAHNGSLCVCASIISTIARKQFCFCRQCRRFVMQTASTTHPFHCSAAPSWPPLRCPRRRTGRLVKAVRLCDPKL